MAKQAKRTYTEKQKAEALELYKEFGCAETYRRLKTKIPRSTLTSWAREAGIQSDGAAKTAKATEMAKLTREQKREQIIDGIHDVALMLNGQMQSMKKIELGDKLIEVALEAKELQALATSFGIYFDKMQLATGGST